MTKQSQKIIIILSVSSDIGKYLAQDYLSRGWRVIGSFRDKKQVADLLKVKNCLLYPCDLSNTASIKAFLKKASSIKGGWQRFISCVGYLLPAQSFFKADFQEWKSSVLINCIEQLGILHGLYPYRDKKHADIVFFAGGGMNNAVANLSAYTASKIFLTKMCEFLDFEEKNINAFIVGPGFTKTKIHNVLLSDKRSAKVKADETKSFLKEKEGTPLEDIAQCIEILCQKGRKVAGGRNFSVVYDPWQKDKNTKLIEALKADANMYKLRRHGNNFK